MSRPFTRVRGGVEIRLTPTETDAVRPLFRQMLELLGEREESDDLRRLFPPAYEHDAEAQHEYESLTRDDLREAKQNALRTADATFDRLQLRRGALVGRLDEDEQQAWLTSLNDLRLYLGTKLDVTEEMYEALTEEPEPGVQLYLYLGWLEESLVETLLG